MADTAPEEDAGFYQSSPEVRGHWNSKARVQRHPTSNSRYVAAEPLGNGVSSGLSPIRRSNNVLMPSFIISFPPWRQTCDISQHFKFNKGKFNRSISGMQKSATVHLSRKVIQAHWI